METEGILGAHKSRRVEKSIEFRECRGNHYSLLCSGGKLIS